MGHRRKTAARLAALHIETVDDLASTDAAYLAARLGPTMGPWYRRLGRGVDSSPVDPTPWVPRGHGREETFQEDLTDRAAVEEAVRRLARRAHEDVLATGRPVVRVGLKVRTAAFATTTRSRALAESGVETQVVVEAAVALLDLVEPGLLDRPIRLLGVRLEMTEPVSARP